MTVASGNSSAGDTDGSANDSVSIIDLTDQSHPTVNFDTAEENKTIRLSLFGRLNHTATADKNIDVELVDATTIGGMISAKGGDSVTISGSQAGWGPSLKAQHAYFLSWTLICTTKFFDEEQALFDTRP